MLLVLGIRLSTRLVNQSTRFPVRFTLGRHTKSLLTDILVSSRPLSSGTLTTEKSTVAACMAVAVASMASDKDIPDRLLCID